MILLMVGSVVAGVGLAQWGVIPESLVDRSGTITKWALYALLIWIGYDMARARQAIVRLLSVDRYVFLVPVGSVVGTLIGGLLAAAFIDLSVTDSLAVSAGFGWYSLSAVIISDIESADLGSVAFLCNVSREVFSIALIPIVAKAIGPYVSVAPGGATTMDTTLPIIEKYAGQSAALVGFVHGFALSALVPVLVPFFLSV